MVFGAIMAMLLLSPSLAAMQTTMLLKCTVTDEYSGKPVAVKYSLKSSDGKTVKGKTRESDGSFQAVLAPGMHYEIILSNYNILKMRDTIVIADRGEYFEDTREFTVKVLSAGQQLVKENIFEQGNASISAAGKAALKDLVDIMKKNRPLYVRVTACVEQSGDSKKKKRRSSKDNSATQKLVDERVQVLTDYFKEAGKRVSRRVKIVGENSEQPHNVVVAVEKVNNPFD